MKNEPEDEFEKGLREILSHGEKDSPDKPDRPVEEQKESGVRSPEQEKPPKKIGHRTEMIIRIVSALIAVMLLVLFVMLTVLR